MSTLTNDQRRVIEEKRKKAIALREAKRLKQGPSSSSRFPVTGKDDDVSIVKEIKSKSVMPAEQSARSQLMKEPQHRNPQIHPQNITKPAVLHSPDLNLTRSAPQSPFSRPNSLPANGARPRIAINSPALVASRKNSAVIPNSQSSSSGGSNPGSQKTKNEGVAPIFGKASKIPIKISLCQESRVSLEFGYNARLVEAVKKLPSSRYEAPRWTISVHEYLKAIETFQELKQNGLNVEVDKDSVPAKVVALVRNEMDKMDVDVNLSERLDQRMIDKMFPFQREGAKFAIRKGGRCLIGDDMGLGKTVQALAAASWFKEDWPLLIVCPASVAVNWQNNVLTWLDFLCDHDVEVFDKPGSLPLKKVLIISYDRLVKVVDDVFKHKMNVVILDESHNIKNVDAQRTRAAIQVSKKVKRIILLSGTPALSRPLELYSQILAINNQLFPKKHDFGVRYCNARLKFMGKHAQVWDYKGCSNSEELKILLESTIMIRRLKIDVLQDLPTKRRVVVELPLRLSEEARKKMDELGKKLDSNTQQSMFRNILSDWYTETAAQKVDAIIEYLSSKLERCKKFICFGYHKVMFEALSDFLKKKNISFIVITGETPPRVRQECCDFFQSNPTCRVALVSIVAAGVGITLTAAHEVVFTELYWNPGILTQAEDRAHRIGQEETVTIEYLLSPKTVDDYIWSVVGRKLNVLNKVGLSEDQMKNSIHLSSSQSTIEQFFQKIVDDVPKEDVIMLN